MATLNVSLTPELEAYVRSKVGTGSYQSASEVIREALRIFKREEELRAAKLESLRSDISQGIRELDAGQGIPFEVPELMAKARRTRRVPDPS